MVEGTARRVGVTSLSATRGAADSGAVFLRMVPFVLGPEETAVWTGPGMETGVSGTFLSRLCWLSALHTEVWGNRPKHQNGLTLEEMQVLHHKP